MAIEGIRRLLRLPPSETQARRDAADEVAFHVETRVETLMADGLDEAEARRRALAEFGDVSEAREELTVIARRRARRERRSAMYERAWTDLRQAWRSLRRDPLFTLGVLVTLSLGMGVNVPMFGVTDRLLLQPPPHVEEPDRVVRVYFGYQDAYVTGLIVGFPYVDYVAVRDGAPALTNAAAYCQPAEHRPNAQEVRQSRAHAHRPQRCRLATSGQHGTPIRVRRDRLENACVLQRCHLIRGGWHVAATACTPDRYHALAVREGERREHHRLECAVYRRRRPDTQRERCGGKQEESAMPYARPYRHPQLVQHQVPHAHPPAT